LFVWFFVFVFGSLSSIGLLQTICNNLDFIMSFQKKKPYYNACLLLRFSSIALTSTNQTEPRGFSSFFLSFFFLLLPRIAN